MSYLLPSGIHARASRMARRAAWTANASSIASSSLGCVGGNYSVCKTWTPRSPIFRSGMREKAMSHRAENSADYGADVFTLEPPAQLGSDVIVAAPRAVLFGLL